MSPVRRRFGWGGRYTDQLLQRVMRIKATLKDETLESGTFNYEVGVCLQLAWRRTAQCAASQCNMLQRGATYARERHVPLRGWLWSRRLECLWGYLGIPRLPYGQVRKALTEAMVSTKMITVRSALWPGTLSRDLPRPKRSLTSTRACGDARMGMIMIIGSGVRCACACSDGTTRW